MVAAAKAPDVSPGGGAQRRPGAGAKQGDDEAQRQAKGHGDHRERDRDSNAVDECRRRQRFEEDRRLEIHAKPSREWPALAVNAYLMTSSTTGSIWYFFASVLSVPSPLSAFRAAESAVCRSGLFFWK